jgi:hypothetical protein
VKKIAVLIAALALALSAAAGSTAAPTGNVTCSGSCLGGGGPIYPNLYCSSYVNAGVFVYSPYPFLWVCDVRVNHFIYIGIY